jgi:hypothetical protein
LHLALPPVAFFIAGGQRSELRVDADSLRALAPLIRIAPQVVAGRALVELSSVAASR